MGKDDLFPPVISAMVFIKPSMTSDFHGHDFPEPYQGVYMVPYGGCRHTGTVGQDIEVYPGVFPDEVIDMVSFLMVENGFFRKPAIPMQPVPPERQEQVGIRRVAADFLPCAGSR
jgi:hypothetical protein